MSSSISRQLVLWLAVPLMLLALCSALVHYFNSVAPGVVDSDRRLREAAIAVVSQVQTHDGATSQVPAAEGVIFAVRDPQGRLLAGDPRVPVITLNGDATQSSGRVPLNHRAARSQTLRLDTAAGVVLVTVVDTRPTGEPTARATASSARSCGTSCSST